MSVENFKNIAFERRSHCMVCSKLSEDPIFSLPNFPLTEIYVKEKSSERAAFLDQHFHFCENCGHGQISNVIPPSTLYGNSYHYRTSTSETGSAANDAFLKFIHSTIGDRHFKKIIEIGCGDLYLLNSLKDRADKIIGIDPILEESEDGLGEEKLTVIGDFIENVDLSQIDLNDSLIICSHTLEHVENPKEMLSNLFQHATPSTLFFFQFPGLDGLLENLRFDQIFHQHLNYFSCYSFNYLLKSLGSHIINSDTNPHWGSLLFAFKKGSVFDQWRFIAPPPDKEGIMIRGQLFDQRMQSLKLLLQSFEGEKIIGYGAALTLPVLAYHLSDDFSGLPCIFDDDEGKENLFYINLPVPIKNSKDMGNIKDDTVFITAIDNTRKILSKVIPLQPKRIVTVMNNI